jgi:LDH2 family malate/lactate/ureidoglycolate dehydrogenase
MPGSLQLVKADLRGIHSHGVMRVPLYAGKLTRGGVDPQGCPRVIKDASAALVVDGDNSMGEVAGAFAMRQAIERTRVTNVAVAAVATATIAAPWSTMCAWRSTPT